MFRILLTLLVSFSFLIANAQFKKGDVLTGGTLYYSNNKSTSPYSADEQKNYAGIFNISLGKAIRENAVFGINLNYQPTSDTYGDGSGLVTDKTIHYGIAVFYRLYKNLGKEFYIFGEAGAGYTGSTSSTKDSTGHKISTGKGYEGSIYISPGIGYKISKKFYLELSIPQLFLATYSGSRTKSGSVTTASTDQFYVNANLNSNPLNSLGIGFRLIL